MGESDIDRLRTMIRVFNHCNETFNQRFDRNELWALYVAYTACGWDITPDEWTDRQVSEALIGLVPRWDENEEPIYST